MDIGQLVASETECPKQLRCLLHHHLTLSEMRCIWTEFQKHCPKNRQVLWTGVPRARAQQWADRLGLQTLETAMGPYMDVNNPSCPRKKKTPKKWTEYIHGASALFALIISKSDYVTVLCNIPPQRFHPTGDTSFQCIELPILTGQHGNRPVGRIDMVHPFSTESAAFTYQFWPDDHTLDWQCCFHDLNPKVKWRPIKRRNPSCSLVRSGKRRLPNFANASAQLTLVGAESTRPRGAVESTKPLKDQMKALNVRMAALVQELAKDRKKKNRDLIKLSKAAAREQDKKRRKTRNKQIDSMQKANNAEYLHKRKQLNQTWKSRQLELRKQHHTVVPEEQRPSTVTETTDGATMRETVTGPKPATPSYTTSINSLSTEGYPSVADRPSTPEPAARADTPTRPDVTEAMEPSPPTQNSTVDQVPQHHANRSKHRVKRLWRHLCSFVHKRL